MPTTGKLSLSEGVISVSAHSASHVEAAVVGDTAGLELTVNEANVYVGREDDRRPGVTLTIAMHRATLLQIATAALDGLGTPAFTQDEWLEIANVLDTSAAQVNRDRAARIREAYS